MFGYRKEIDKGNENNFFSDLEPLEGLCAPNTENRIFSPKVGSMIHTERGKFFKTLWDSTDWLSQIKTLRLKFFTNEKFREYMKI